MLGKTAFSESGGSLMNAMVIPVVSLVGRFE